jgi:type I restriction enzyme S subunit
VTKQKKKAVSKFTRSFVTSAIPHGWSLVTAGSLLTDTEYGLSEPGDVEGDTSIVGMKNIGDGKVVLSNLSTINSNDADLSKMTLRKGDILLNRTNSPDLVGKVGIVRENSDAVFASYLVRLTIDPERVDAEYLNAWLNGDIAQRAIKRISTRAVSQANVNPTEFQKYCPVLLPGTEKEQTKIASVLQTWDEAIDKLELLCEAKQQRRDAVAQRLLAPAQSIGKPKKSGWKKSTLGKVFTEHQDRNSGLDSESVITVGKYAIRNQSEHFTRSVASSDLSNYWTISPGDFVYDPMSAYYGALGQYTGDSDGIVSPAYRVIRLSKDVLPTFMVYLLKSHRIRFLLEARSSQGNKEGKRRLLQRDEFEDIDFFLPPMDEQRRIATILAAFERDLETTATLIAQVKRQKRGLMQKLLTGEWRVKL